MSEQRFSKNTRIMGYRRLHSTSDGNPVIRLFLEDGSTTKTSPNASVAYQITNEEWHDRPVTLYYGNHDVIGISLGWESV